MTSKDVDFKFETTSPDETIRLGEALGTVLQPGLVIGLVGNLGAGKTHFVKGLALGNGLDDTRRVTSPTFALVHEYPGKLPIYHVDVYRLTGIEDLESTGFEEFSMAKGVTALEWADRVEDIVPEGALWLKIESTGETRRSWHVTTTSQFTRECAQAWQEAYAHLTA